MVTGLQKIRHWTTNIGILGFLGLMKMLPYDLRLHLCGLTITHVVAPLTGARKRIRNNLALIMPELSASEVKSIVLGVPYHMGRSVMELYSGREFSDRISEIALDGPGLSALDQACNEGRGVMLITGHIGNYDAVRAALIERGFPVGSLYKPMKNSFFNEHYVKAMNDIGSPMFERGRHGLAEMLRFLRSGGMVGVVLDQSISSAPLLNFMGKPARTALSAAEMALKQNALVVPCYGIRKPDGSFDIIVEDPVAHDAPEAMTQTLNDSLENQVRAHPEQWMWTHNRWKNADNETPKGS